MEFHRLRGRLIVFVPLMTLKRIMNVLCTVNIVSEWHVLQQLLCPQARRSELSYNSDLRLKDGMFSPPCEDIKHMRKQWKPGPFLLPLSSQGMRLGNYPSTVVCTIRTMIKGAYLDPAGSLATTATENVWEHGTGMDHVFAHCCV